MSTGGPYTVGQQVELSATFKSAGVLAEPTSPKFLVIDGNGNEVKYEAPTRVSLGVWTQVITTTCPGKWRYRGESTEGVQAAGQKSFRVLDDPF